MNYRINARGNIYNFDIPNILHRKNIDRKMILSPTVL